MINLCKIEEKTVSDVFLNWDYVDFVHTKQNVQEIEEKIISSGHTRMPVLEEDHVIGIINTKEVLALLKRENFDWKKLIRDPILFEENVSLLRALNTLQKSRAHMGIIQTSGKPPVGVVILEDIIEEIFGQIYDEDDDGYRPRRYP